MSPGDVAPGSRRGAIGRLLRSELRLVFGRRRNQILLVALGLVPLLIGIAVKVSRGSGGGRGPDFINQVSSNGLFLVFTAIGVSLPLFLPLAVGIVSGDTIAGEASAGTLRYLLVVPVSRSRLLAAKAFGSMTFAAAAVLTISAVGLIAGAALFGLGDVTLLSGDTVGIGDGLLHADRGTGRGHGHHDRGRRHQQRSRRAAAALRHPPLPAHPPLAGLRRAPPVTDRRTDPRERTPRPARLDRCRRLTRMGPLHHRRRHSLTRAHASDAIHRARSSSSRGHRRRPEFREGAVLLRSLLWHRYSL